MKLVGYRLDTIPLIQLKINQRETKWYKLLGIKVINKESSIVEVTYTISRSKKLYRNNVTSLIDINRLLDYFYNPKPNNQVRNYRRLKLPDLSKTKLISHEQLSEKLQLGGNAIHSLTDNALRKRGYLRVGYYGNTLLYSVI